MHDRLILKKYGIILLVAVAFFSLQAFDTHYLRNAVVEPGKSENLDPPDTTRKWPATFGFGRVATTA